MRYNLSQKFGAIALITLLCVMLLPTAGCNGTTVAQDIVNWTPTLQSAVAAVDATGAILDPAIAPVFVTATVGFDAASNLVVAEAKAYLANPTPTLLATLQQTVIVFQQQVNQALLSAVKILDPVMQQKVLAVIGFVGTAINAILALLSTIKGNTIAAPTATACITIDQLKRSGAWNEQLAIAVVAEHYGESRADAAAQVAYSQQQLAYAGF